MSRFRTACRDVTLTGYILPEKKVSRARDEDEDSGDLSDPDEDPPEFLDMREMINVNSGAQFLRTSIPRRNQVTLKALSGHEYRVEGCFALRSPWWEVTCTVRRLKNKLVVRGYPSYKLRSDPDREGWRSLVSLFLAACNIEPEFITSFFSWLPKESDITITNLMEFLVEFSEDQHVGEAQSITAKLLHSVAGKQVHASTHYPHVMKHLPTLLPGHFAGLLGNGKRRGNKRQEDENCEKEEGKVDLSLLAKLEDIIINDVWKLGLNYVVYNELQLVRCEAKLGAFMDCNLLQQIPPLQRNALQLYDELNKFCNRTGSTYMDQQALCEVLRSIMPDEDVWMAVQFLRDLGVVVRDKQKVVLHNFHAYESGIAKALRTLVEDDPWQIPLNVREVLYAAAEERQRLDIHKKASSQSNTDHEVKSHIVSTSELSHETNGTDQEAVDPNPKDQVLAPIELDPEQVRAAEMICANPVTIISGKGGSGKTTVVSLVLRAMVQGNSEEEEIKKACIDFENDTGGSQGWEFPPTPPGPLSKIEGEEAQECKRAIHGEKEVLLTAPTGRAASLLTNKTKFTAYTLHQVLWSFMSFMNKKKDESTRPLESEFKLEWKFKSVRVLVVDEGSLVSVQLLQSVLTILIEHAQLRKVVILGDVRQLPSIQPGNTLHDLFHSLNVINWAIDLRTNHRTESELIVKNAELISDMGMKRWYGPLQFDAKVDLNASCMMPSADKKFILISLPKDESDDDLQTAIKLLIDSAPGLEKDRDSQFIAFKRADVALINELCCKHYNKHTTRNDKNRLDFRPGDKVCCTKNGYIAEEEKKRRVVDREYKGEKEEYDEEQKMDKLRLCNGEIFFIRQDEKIVEPDKSTKRYLTLDDDDGRLLTVEYRRLQKECKLQHAWARTIHTFQGSENKTIVYVLGDGHAQTWKHVYTAVTRGQKRVYVVAKEDGIAAAIKRREIPRNTRLGGLVKELLVKPNARGQDPVRQPDSSQAQPGTPHRTAPGFGSVQAAPLFSPTTSRSQASSGYSRSLHPKPSGKVEQVEVDVTDLSRMKDMAFSQAYSWPPMNSSEDHSAEQHGPLEELAAEASCAVGENCPSTPLSERSPSSRRMRTDEIETPSKQLKTEVYQSPIGCSNLQQLSLSTPKKRKNLFKD